MTTTLQAGQEMARLSCFSLDCGNVQDLSSLTKGAETEELAAAGHDYCAIESLVRERIQARLHIIDHMLMTYLALGQ